MKSMIHAHSPWSIHLTTCHVLYSYKLCDSIQYLGNLFMSNLLAPLRIVWFLIMLNLLTPLTVCLCWHVCRCAEGENAWNQRTRVCYLEMGLFCLRHHLGSHTHVRKPVHLFSWCYQLLFISISISISLSVWISSSYTGHLNLNKVVYYCQWILAH